MSNKKLLTEMNILTQKCNALVSTLNDIVEEYETTGQVEREKLLMAKIVLLRCKKKK